LRERFELGGESLVVEIASNDGYLLQHFISGLKTLLHPRGVVTMEFPLLQQLMRQNQFDTIYHEHYSYLSWLVVEQSFARQGLRIFDVEELSTHGGSLRIFARHADADGEPESARLGQLRDRESAFGLDRLETYTGFSETVHATKHKLLEFLIAARAAGDTVVGYGAPGKGNTLLNYCGIRTDLLDYTVDRSPTIGEHMDREVPVFAL
jgi:hypothetical protein